MYRKIQQGTFPRQASASGSAPHGLRRTSIRGFKGFERGIAKAEPPFSNNKCRSHLVSRSGRKLMAEGFCDPLQIFLR
ncbi:hypothetical protein [Stenotrophomonas maltophilia group sp. CASM55]|uniref:hypothetical protein n=1 Tax=Stenotrophomonas maltophilia group sp. CASM55 TaxID=3111515 RepID=UPI003BF7EA52